MSSFIYLTKWGKPFWILLCIMLHIPLAAGIIAVNMFWSSVVVGKCLITWHMSTKNMLRPRLLGMCNNMFFPLETTWKPGQHWQDGPWWWCSFMQCQPDACGRKRKLHSPNEMPAAIETQVPLWRSLKGFFVFIKCAKNIIWICHFFFM